MFFLTDRWRRGAGYLLPGELGVSPSFNFPQDWGIQGVDLFSSLIKTKPLHNIHLFPGERKLVETQHFASQ